VRDAGGAAVIDAAHPDRAALLGQADRDHALLVGRGVQVRADCGELVLARAKWDERYLVLLGEAAHRAAEGVANGTEQRRRRDGVAAVIAQEGDHAAAALQQRDVRVEDHAVEALDVERHVPLEGLRHRRLPLRSAIAANSPMKGGDSIALSAVRGPSASEGPL